MSDLSVETVLDAKREMDEHRGELETAQRNGRRHVREQLVYQLHEQRSYFADRWVASTDQRGAGEAGERLERHGRQMQAIPRETRSVPGTEFEYRVNPNLETGHGLEFTVPLWLNEYFATARRPEQVIQRLVAERGMEFDLPDGCSSISLQRITQGTTVNDQTPNDAVDEGEVETATVEAQVIQYSGKSDWSLQALEQSPPGPHLDFVVFKDAREALDAELEKDFIVGKGKEVVEALGLLEIAGTNSVTYTAAAPSGTGMFPFIGRALAQVGVKRQRPPTAVLMTTSRFFWISTSEDQSNRPLLLEDYEGEEFPIAGLSGVGVYVDDAIPTTLGASKEQDAIIAIRPEGFMLWHGALRTAVYEEPLSGSMGVRFLLTRYTATMLHRYPSAISKVTGTGMKVQEGFS